MGVCGVEWTRQVDRRSRPLGLLTPEPDAMMDWGTDAMATAVSWDRRGGMARREKVDDVNGEAWISEDVYQSGDELGVWL